MTSTRAFTTPDPPRQIIVDRSFSSRSDVSTSSDKSRHWTPATQSIPLSSIEGKEGKGGMMGKSYLGEAERGLSSCEPFLQALFLQALSIVTHYSICRE